uniref:Uncharacterized protein n=1 Tax=Sarcoptes scabiei TaxID=52283 RepID=A0A834R1Z6_SARSC
MQEKKMLAKNDNHNDHRTSNNNDGGCESNQIDLKSIDLLSTIANKQAISSSSLSPSMINAKAVLVRTTTENAAAIIVSRHQKEGICFVDFGKELIQQ